MSLSSADSQRVVDLMIEVNRDRFADEIAKTAATSPLDGHVYVRCDARSPVMATHLRWRMVGTEVWRTVQMFGGMAWLELGPPRPGPQVADIEIEWVNRGELLWRGVRQVSYAGVGSIEQIGLRTVGSVEIGAFIDSVRGSLVWSRTGLPPLLMLPIPAASENTTSTVLAFKVEVCRDGLAVGQGVVAWGLGHPPTTCGNGLNPSVAMEWTQEALVREPEKAKWTMRLTGVPELCTDAACAMHEQTFDGPPLTMFRGVVETPLTTTVRPKPPLSMVLKRELDAIRLRLGA